MRSILALYTVLALLVSVPAIAAGQQQPSSSELLLEMYKLQHQLDQLKEQQSNLGQRIRDLRSSEAEQREKMQGRLEKSENKLEAKVDRIVRTSISIAAVIISIASIILGLLGRMSRNKREELISQQGKLLEDYKNNQQLQDVHSQEVKFLKDQLQEVKAQEVCFLKEQLQEIKAQLGEIKRDAAEK
jgi:predicted PurR-regulated permease PerM